MIDINTVRSMFTLILFIAFIGVCIWAYSPKRKKSFKEAAMLPFSDTNISAIGTESQNSQQGDHSNE